MSKKRRANNFIRQKNTAIETTEDIARKILNEKEIVVAPTPEPVVKEVKEEITVTTKEKEDIYDPNFESIIDEVDENEEDTKDIKTEKHNSKRSGGFKMNNNQKTAERHESGFTRPLNLQYGVTSIEFLKRFKNLVETQLPELHKCIVSTTITVANVPKVIDGAHTVVSQVKFIMKLDLIQSDILRRDNAATKSTNYSGDPQFDALFEASQNDLTASSSNNWKKMPKYLQEKGKNILYNDFNDVLKFEPFRSKDGKVWQNLVLLEVDASASIISILGMDHNLYIGYTDLTRRMKQLEESLKMKQKMRGKVGAQVPTIYWIQVKVDDLELLKTSSAMFNKPKYQQATNKGGSSYKSALADFIGR